MRDNPTFTQKLDQIQLHQVALVTAVNPPPNALEWLVWLEEIGFVPGAFVRLVGRTFGGKGALAVDVGTARFALSQAEAACIWVHVVGTGCPVEIS